MAKGSPFTRPTTIILPSTSTLVMVSSEEVRRLEVAILFQP